MKKMNEIRQQIRSMLQIEPGENGFHARLHIDPAFRLLPDHFANNPIFPGMCLIQAVLLAAATHAGVPDLRLCLLKNAKFLAPALPGDIVLITADISPHTDGTFLIKANLFIREQRISQITLTAQPQPVAEDAPQ